MRQFLAALARGGGERTAVLALGGVWRRTPGVRVLADSRVALYIRPGTPNAPQSYPSPFTTENVNR